jgi:hypothetical protein
MVVETKRSLKKFSNSEKSLILINLIPLFGVLFFNWSVTTILLIYWTESLVIGFFSILKIFYYTPLKKTDEAPLPMRIFISAFFTFHYGGFMMGHLIFIFAITFFGKGVTPYSALLPIIKDSIIPVISSFLFLAISHTISFNQNFIKNKEYTKTKKRENVMVAPYKRIFLMQIVLIFGGILSTVFNSSAIIALFVILKIFLDIFAHRKEHEK